MVRREPVPSRSLRDATPDRFLDIGTGAGGARLRYRDEGSAAPSPGGALGSPLLLIHGWTYDLDIWEPLAQMLAARHRVLSIDRRGFGLSTGQPSLAQDQADILALLDHTRVARAVLLGASQGARLALSLGLAAPERVAAVVLDGPPEEVGSARHALTVEIPLAEYRALAQSGQMAEVRRRWSQHPFARLCTRDPAAHARLATTLARYSGADLLEPSPPVPPPLDGLRSLGMPALVINGEHDLESRRASGLALAQALPRARHAIIPDAGHLPHLDNPGAYLDALEQFLESMNG